MNTDQRQEQFSLAYVRAVSAVAGFLVQEGPKPDVDSIDLTISAVGPLGSVRSPKIDLQLKSTRSEYLGDPIGYPLRVKNYEDLRHSDFACPRILVVVFVPPEIRNWIRQSDHEMAMHHCGYWISLRGGPPMPNKNTVTVYISRSNQFSADGLNGIMERIGRGKAP